MKRFRSHFHALCGKILIAVALPGLLVVAEPVAAETDEIVVTTRKREENLQDVPIAVTAISGDFIERAGVRDLRDIAQLDPSLSVNEFFSQNDTRITIRGLTNTRGRANLAFLVDGIDVTSEPMGNSGSPLLVNQRLLNDVARIEVVKGPQSALYGRAAFAGALNYITKDPGDEFEVSTSLDVSDQESYEVGGAITIPLMENTLSTRFNVVNWDADGYYPNEVTGSNLGGGNGTGVSGTLLYTPADTLRIKTRFSYSSDDYEPRATARLTEGAVTLPVPDVPGLDLDESVEIIPEIGDADGLVVQSSENPRTGTDYFGTRTDILRGTVAIDWNLSNWDFSSLTGFTDATTDQMWDLDRQAEGRPDTVLGHAEVNSTTETKQFSQEFRVASNWDSAVQITVGGLYWKEERTNADRSITSVCFQSVRCPLDGLSGWQDVLLSMEAANAVNGGFSIASAADTDSWSLYALAEWDINAQWKLTVEDRYVNEKFTRMREKGSACVVYYPLKILPDGFLFDTSDDFSCVHGPDETGSVRSSFQTPKLMLEFMLSEDILIYGSVSKAQKPGGISGGGAPGPFTPDFESLEFLPEKMWAYELGAKTSWSGAFGELTLNGAVFYQDYSDKQISVRTIINGFLVGRTANASAASVTGLELATNWATPLEGLTLGVAYTYLNAEYDDFLDVTTDERRIAVAGGCTDVVDLAGTLNCVVDLSGNKIELAPEHAASGFVNLTRPVASSSLEWFLETNVQYQGERYTTDNNEATLDDYWMVNARGGLTADRWSATLYIDNVFDDNTLQNWGNSPDFGAAVVDGGFDGFFKVMEIVALPNPRTVGMRVSVDF
jgi:iron complex outermembrane receptor protein